MTADIPLNKKKTNPHQLCNSWRSVLRVSGYCTVLYSCQASVIHEEGKPSRPSGKMHLKGPPLPGKVYRATFYLSQGAHAPKTGARAPRGRGGGGGEH